MKKTKVIVLLIFLICGTFNHVWASDYIIERLSQYNEGYAVAGIWQGAWKYGFIDESGNWMLEPQYDVANNFYEGIASVGVKKDENSPVEYGYIKKDGTFLVSPEYDYASSFYGGYAVIRKKVNGSNQYGMIDKYGNIVLDIKYSSISGSTNSYLGSNFKSSDVIYFDNEEGLYGLYIPKLNKYIEPKYSNAPIVVGDYILIYSDTDGKDKIGIIFMNNGKVIEPSFDNRTYSVRERIYDDYGVKFTFKYTGVQVEKNGKFGILDLNGNYVFDTKYDELTTSEIGFIIAESNGKKEIFKSDGTHLINQKYDDILSYNWRSNYTVILNGKAGMLNIDGSYLIEPKYDEIYGFDLDGYAQVLLNGKKGIIHRNGKEILQPVYDYIYTDFYLQQTEEESIQSDGSTTYTYKDDTSMQSVVKVKKDGKEYFLNSDFTPMKGDGQSAIGDYDEIGMFKDGIARVTKGDKVGYVRADFTYIVQPIYDSAYQSTYGGVEQDYFTIKKGEKWGAVFMDGTVIEPVHDYPPQISEDIVLCLGDEKYQFITKNSEPLNGDEYKRAHLFSEGKAIVCEEYGQVYFIDKNGKKVSEVYQNASSYGEGLAFVNDGTNGKYIDHNENVILGENLDLWQGYPFKNDLAIASIYVEEVGRGLYGILKRDGTWLIEPTFDEVKSYGNGEYKYFLKGKEATITPQGEISWK